MSEQQQGLRHKERRKTLYQTWLDDGSFHDDIDTSILLDDDDDEQYQEFHAILKNMKSSSSSSSSLQMPFILQSSSSSSSSSSSRYLEGEDAIIKSSPPPPPPPAPPTNNQGGGGGRSQNNTAVDGTLTILVLLTVIFCFVWSPSLIRRCDPRYQERRRLRSAARAAQRAAEEAALAAVMSGDSDAMMPNGVNVSPVLPHGMSEEDRRDYVSNVLVTKKVITSPNQQKNTEQSSLEPYTIERNKSDLVIMPSSMPPTEAASPSDQYSENTCAICLLEYEENDEICWSHNKRCNHAFHRECILEWLMRHDDCPCCRHNYLTLDDHVEEGNGGEEAENSNNNNNNTGGIDVGSGDGERGDATRGDSNNNNNDNNNRSVQSGIFRRHLLPSFLFGSPRQTDQTANTNDAVELTTAVTTDEPPVSTPPPMFANEPVVRDTNLSGGDADTTVLTEDSANAEPTDVSPTRGRFLARLRFINNRNNGGEEREDVVGVNQSQASLEEGSAADGEDAQDSHVDAENVRSRQEESTNAGSNSSDQTIETATTTDETSEIRSTEVERVNAGNDVSDNVVERASVAVEHVS